jgi:hypothetical protein
VSWRIDVQQALSLMQGTLKSVKVLETFSDSTLDNSDLSNVGFWPIAASPRQEISPRMRAI